MQVSRQRRIRHDDSSGGQGVPPVLKYSGFLTAEGLEKLPDIANGCFDIFGTGATLMAAYQPNAMSMSSSWYQALELGRQFYLQGHDALCKAGNKVEYHEFPGLDHIGILTPGTPMVVQWIEDRFNGKATVNTCTSTS
ncbi:hypothetical protein HDU87_001579 [Geranomyces variabilis]|uniref:Triacylglycerol lipase n=1 Tax=Geranomyces variabilis TaxID=109894 RepID=A0AAD5TMU3_9FUNG|nr:hypothetical protein HDU87_001579 [Geranomyces variabilis]